MIILEGEHFPEICWEFSKFSCEAKKRRTLSRMVTIYRKNNKDVKFNL